MTTGMSAPPMDAVRWAPSRKERPVVAPRQLNPVDIEASFMYTPKEPAHRAAPVRFIRFLPGRLRAGEARRPWSLPYATSEPVKVTPPISVPR